MDWCSLYYRTKFWVTDFFKGSPIGKHYREVKYLSTHNASDTVAYREKKLKDFLKYVSTNSPFYGSYLGRSLSYFPVVNKSMLLENYDEIRIPQDKIPGQKGKLHIQSTSGSTGTPFAIPQDTEKRNRRIAELKYFGKVVGFKSHDMLVHLRTWNRWQTKTPAQISRERIIPFDISTMGEENLAQLVEIINQNKAVCLRGYASSFDLLANYLKAKDLHLPSVRIIIAGSEALHDDVRVKVKEQIGCEIISQYADEEIGILAQESIPTSEKDNVMYLNNASCIVEVLKIETDEKAEYGELGRIVVTDMHNHAFPIVRYDTGDVGIMMPPNGNSNGFPILSKLYGRRLDLCYTTSNQPFSPMTIGRIMKHYDKIAQWQFVQTGEKNYLLKIVMGNSIDGYLNSAIDTLRETLGADAEIEIEYVNEIPVLASGKRKPVVNLFKQ